MGAKGRFIQIPASLEDPQVLRQFLEELISKLDGNALVTYPVKYPTGFNGYIELQDVLDMGAQANGILDASERLDELNNDIKNYITDSLVTNIKQNTEDVALITEQFGTFYDNATAAAWYGIGVKAGEVITGLTIGSVDTDTTSPGSGSGVFAINADSFQIARSITDITDPAELAYLQANGLPYGTMYDSVLGEIVPAFLIEWNGSAYDIFFNGNVTFSNVTDQDQVATAINNNVTTINGGKLTTNTAWIGGSIKSTDFAPFTAGFQLKAEAAGTFADPTIYGAYIRGGYIYGATVEGATLTGTVLDFSNSVKSADGYPDNTGLFLASSISAETVLTSASAAGTYYTAATPSILMPGNGSGFNTYRALSQGNSILKVYSTGIVGFEVNNSVATAILTVQQSINGGAYTDVKSQTFKLQAATSAEIRGSAVVPIVIDLTQFTVTSSVRFRVKIVTTRDADAWPELNVAVGLDLGN